MPICLTIHIKMNTLYTFVDQGSDLELTQARFDRARNSKLVLSEGRVIKRAGAGQIEREVEMLTRARELGVNVPHCIQVDDFLISLQFLPHGETLWDYIQHGKLTQQIMDAVRSAVLIMWKAGIVHGDLHCNNILISNNQVYIIDMASSWDAQVLTSTFGEGDYTADIREGILADKEALLNSIKECKALIK